MVNKPNDVTTFFNILEFAFGCFIAGVAVGIVVTVILGML